MNLYRFITTFCLVPVTDIVAITQRLLAVGQRVVQILHLGKIIKLSKSILSNSLNVASWLVLIEELGRRILGAIGIGSAVASGGATIAQITKLLESIGDPQTALLDYIHSVMIHAPYSIQSLLSSVDSTLASMTSVFNPPITLTYILQVTAVGECFNQLLMSAVQNAVFIFSVFLVRWAFKSNFTFVKSVPGSKP